MIKPSVYLILVLALAVSLQEVCAKKGKRPNFVKLNELLIEALPQDGDPDNNIAEAKDLLEEMSSLEETDKDWHHERIVLALELFISLEETVGKCDSRSSMILMNNYRANGGPTADTSSSRTKRIFNHYRSEYAKECRPYFRKKFYELIKNVKHEDLTRIEAAFSTLEVGDFIYPKTISAFKSGLLEAPIGFAHWNNAKGAISKISTQILNLVLKKPSFWDKFRRNDKSSVCFETDNPLGGKMIEEHLMEPCANYRGQLKRVLDPARIDFVLRDKYDQVVYDKSMGPLVEDTLYRKGLLYNRLCGILWYEDILDILL